MKNPSSLPSPPNTSAESGLSNALLAHIAADIAQSDGWIGFDRFMALALYAPGLGYYAHGSTKFGAMPQGLRGKDGALSGAGSDFVTAPELSPLFGYALARQIAQALEATQTFEIWEFGAGTGALARQLLDALQAMGQRVDRYTIVDLSDSLKERQKTALSAHADRVHWATELPAQFDGVVVGNEVLDAMPVQLLARVQGQWLERGVVVSEGPQQGIAGTTPGEPHTQAGIQTEGDPQTKGYLHTKSGNSAVNAATLVWADKPTVLRPPVDVAGAHDYLTEIHPQAEAFIRTLADRLRRGACFFLDYGFPEGEYYHPQRHMGTVMCHRAHQADGDPLADIGLKDITAHVNFTAIAVAAQDAGLEVLGYTSQAHFLMNCGLVDLMQSAPVPVRAASQKLILEHEMGELFKVIGLVRGEVFDAIGFTRGDRTHRL